VAYLDGQKAAEALCAERSKRRHQESKRWEAEEDRTRCLAAALEAVECAVEIKRLIEEAERLAVGPLQDD
jgi:hypothetical protein